MNKAMVLVFSGVLVGLFAAPIGAAPEVKKVAALDNKDVFYVYKDKGDRLNHFGPSGWMGDYGDLRLNDADKTQPYEGKNNIKISYTGNAKQGANWAGVYWQHPTNNWGSKGGGFNLTGYKRLTFWAKSARKDKKPSAMEFKMGGINGDYSDSDTATTGPVAVPEKWTRYTIDLAGKDLSHIIG